MSDIVRHAGRFMAATVFLYCWAWALGLDFTELVAMVALGCSLRDTGGDDE